MNQRCGNIKSTLTVEISLNELEHLNTYRKLNDIEKENIDRIIEMCLKSKDKHKESRESVSNFV